MMAENHSQQRPQQHPLLPRQQRWQLLCSPQSLHAGQPVHLILATSQNLYSATGKSDALVDCRLRQGQLERLLDFRCQTSWHPPQQQRHLLAQHSSHQLE
jgi:hypothetical protein